MDTYKIERLVSLENKTKETIFERIRLEDFECWFKGKYNVIAVTYSGMKVGVYRPRDKKDNVLDVIYLNKNEQ